MEVQVREYEPKDRAAIEQCILELHEEEYGRRPHFWEPASPEMASTLLDKCLKAIEEKEEMKMYVGVLDGQTVGWIILQVAKTDGPDVALKRYGYVNELGVLRAYQKMGVGLALMNKAEEHIKSLGLEWMRLNTDPQNPALDFYKKLGYKEGSIRLEKKLS